MKNFLIIFLKSIQFISLYAFIIYFLILSKFKKLLSEKLRDLRDTMPRHWSLYFFVIIMSLTGHHAMRVVI